MRSAADMTPARLIERKRDGHALDPEELRDFLVGYQEGSVSEYQMASFLMAVVFQGLSQAELSALVSTMLGSGARLDWPPGPPVVDKHSTGGVGDKVSLVLAPLAAVLGLRVPMMSGRGLGHTGGTLDKLEAIPGFRTDLDLQKFRAVVARHGFAMIGASPEIVPLDRRLYALRSVTGTVPSVPLIAASIMSKKIAEGVDALVLDVKTGRGAFLPERERVATLARTMEAIGEAHGVRTEAVLTDMDAPLGRAVGNGLEAREALHCLAGGGPPGLRTLVVDLVTRMVRLGAGSADPDPRGAAERALDDGRALARFRDVVEAQGGDPAVVDDPDLLLTASVRREVRAVRGGRVTGIDPRALGWGVVDLGGGRRRLEDSIHPGVGFEVAVSVGQTLQAGESLGWVHAASESDAILGERILREAVERSDG